MRSVGNILKRIGKILLWIVLALVVIGVGIFFWLRAEPAAVTECDAGERLMQHYSGGVCIPEEAEKVVSTSMTTNQFFIAIGHPLGMMTEALDYATAADIPGLYERLREINEAAGVLDLGGLEGGAGRNLELLVEIDPDVIISEAPVGDLEKPASLIAPVLIVSQLNGWKEVTLYAGDLVDEKAAAEELLASYEERLQILRDQFDDPSNITVSVVSLRHDMTTLMMPNSFWGQIAADVGFSVPEEHKGLEGTANNQFYDISNERIDLIEADYVFLYGGLAEHYLGNFDTDSQTLIETFQSDPIYQTLSVAESGNVHEVDVYWNTTGIYSAHYVLDDLFRLVAGVDPEDVAPNPLLLSE
ncbi:MAG: ABC transporter substrate-binding protein [Chloroflexota bacterium]